MTKQAPEEEDYPGANASPPPDSVLISRKRHRELEEESGELKKLKEAVENAAEEYVCPITTDLPVDPVMAEDGRVYERSAIEEHIQRQGAGVKSPMTNEPMGAKLLPAVQVRNTIKSLVTSGAILGSKADKWKEKMAEEELVSETREKAEKGNVKSMCLLGHWYAFGEKGLPHDEAKAYQWYKKGSDLRDFRCMTNTGHRLIIGQGVEKNPIYGVSLTSIAAMGGCEGAAFNLGILHKKGMEGLPKDLEHSKYWLKKVADGHCSVLHSGHNELRASATRILQEINSVE